jgi:hypothetical protein
MRKTKPPEVKGHPPARHTRGLLVLLLLTLSGCFNDQKQQLAKCELEARQYPPRSNEAITYINLCMQANGYEWDRIEKRCTVGRFDDWSMDELRNPYCYEPTGWLARGLYRLQIGFQTNTR